MEVGQWSKTDATIDQLITSKDHASVQITIADVDAEGKALSTGTTFALSGAVRAMGESDDSINRLATKAGRKFLDTPPDSFELTSFQC